jgi:hypothetical protein
MLVFLVTSLLKSIQRFSLKSATDCRVAICCHLVGGLVNMLGLNFKGIGTRDYSWLKVVWSDGSWLGESPADIQKFLTVPLILY